MNMQQINGLKCSILTILEKSTVPERDMKPKLPMPFSDNKVSLLVSKILYFEKQADLDKFLKAQRLTKKEYDADYWEITDWFEWDIRDSL